MKRRKIRELVYSTTNYPKSQSITKYGQSEYTEVKLAENPYSQKDTQCGIGASRICWEKAHIRNSNTTNEI
jgi:hypothetical protein